MFCENKLVITEYNEHALPLAWAMSREVNELMLEGSGGLDHYEKIKWAITKELERLLASIADDGSLKIIYESLSEANVLGIFKDEQVLSMWRHYCDFVARELGCAPVYGKNEKVEFKQFTARDLIEAGDRLNFIKCKDSFFGKCRYEIIIPK